MSPQNIHKKCATYRRIELLFCSVISEDVFTFDERKLSNFDQILLRRASDVHYFQGWFLRWVCVEFTIILSIWYLYFFPYTFIYQFNTFSYQFRCEVEFLSSQIKLEVDGSVYYSVANKWINDGFAHRFNLFLGNVFLSHSHPNKRSHR